MKFYYHPISSYAQKALIAFYELDLDFEPHLVDLPSSEAMDAYRKLYPQGKVPMLVLDDGRQLPEATLIIERLNHIAQGETRLIPEDFDAAELVRLRDRQADLYLNESFQKLFFDARLPEEQRDPVGVEAAKRRLQITYAAFDEALASSPWLAGESFSMADCAAAPALFYLSSSAPFSEYKHLAAYYQRLSARPSVARVNETAAPYIKALLG
ncbi:glutathione S-transferase family protein [Haliangium ochraceum]|uniref:Glutathione S-transferase domain protein n=1 Tax=Haliangium ochraceum (strain DSM 14365 / JCM 11303 / SMP-2) TaxID=502025 RepID=D0LVK4_HALO1|nr:glutathione S-transferase family protein [Haliangium ochraceum]ACY17565.1 Glutathione S-transferase domain protein [Haliangium ochraceum DSM 14365]